MRTTLISFALALAAGFAFAHDYALGEISIKHPVAYPTVGRTGAGYMEIMNEGPADRLVGVSAEFPRVMLHESVTENDVTRMEHRMAVDLPTGEMVTFKPGGLHVMFMGLSEHWKVGDEIPATLNFETAGSVDVVFKVEERPTRTEGETDHGAHQGMDHSNH